MSYKVQNGKIVGSKATNESIDMSTRPQSGPMKLEKGYMSTECRRKFK
jgi:hypothetical protein